MCLLMMFTGGDGRTGVVCCPLHVLHCSSLYTQVSPPQEVVSLGQLVFVCVLILRLANARFCSEGFFKKKYLY